MPMERSMSCAERSTVVTAPANDLRCHSASFAPVVPRTKMQRAKSDASWSRPAVAAAPAVQRSGSTKTTVAGAGPTPGLNLRCYSASYAASYNPFSDAQAKGPSPTAAAPVWCSAGRRSLNLRSYTPSFAALVDDEAPAPAKKADDAEAELQRKKRLVAYKVYDVEGKVKGSVRRSVKWIKGKGSVRRSVKWIKGKCSRAVYGM